MPVNFAVLGSVITRNSLKLFNDIRIVSYVPKVSVASLFNPNHCDITSLDAMYVSNDFFIKKLIELDLSKDTKSIVASPTDVIVIDFFDDFFDFLVEPISKCTITKSNYLTRYGLHSSIFEEWETIERFSEKGFQIWQEGCERFLESILQNTVRLCLIKSYFPEYIICDGKQCLLGTQALTNIRQCNFLLEQYYSLISNNMQCDVIDVPSELLSDSVTSYGIALSNQSLDLEKFIAESIAKLYGIEEFYIPPLSDRIESLFSLFAPLMKHIPSIAELLDIGKIYEKEGYGEEARKCEKLIMILHNSHVPITVLLGKGVSFGYGGIGTIVHANAKIGNYVVIGSNVTIGGGKSMMLDGVPAYVPVIDDRVYIATGAKILGGIKIGHHTIIGANSVVTKDVPPYSVVAGNPSKIINTITEQNFQNYISYLYKGLSSDIVKKLMFPDIKTLTKPLKIAIIGSCVTRDCFKHIDNTEILYVARSSFISLISKSADIQEDQILIEGNFERKMVHWDLNKEFLKKLSDFKPDCVILDFIDERFDIIKYNSGYYTRSNYLVNSGVLDRMNGYQIIRRQAVADLWTEACREVGTVLRSLTDNIILHKTHWATRYRNTESDVIVNFDADTANIAHINNAILNSYYDVIQREIPELKVIDYDPILLYSDFAHQWGKDYFHFGNQYYCDISDKIKVILNEIRK